MKVGDLVRLKTASGLTVGIVVGIEENGWCSVLLSDSRISLWPGQEMERMDETG
jgi:hypothetical protein